MADQIAGQLQRLQVHQVRGFLRLRPRLLVGAAEGPQSKETWRRRQSGGAGGGRDCKVYVWRSGDGAGVRPASHTSSLSRK